jgi:diacylglycerol kinase (ATP)
MIPFPRPTGSPPRAKLIFNPISGAPGESPTQLMQIIGEMQALDLTPEVHLIQQETDLRPVIREAYQRGIRLFVVSGGDGSVDAVAGALVGTRAVLGIIPTGTRNNVALSLGIPADIPSAVALLRDGRVTKVDTGLAVCGQIEQPFLEACSVGLLSALFPAADDIQHGNLARIADLLATLVASPPAEMRLVLDRKQVIQTQGHVVLITNMPYLGPNYQVASPGSFLNGLLEVLVFANLSKLDLISKVVTTAGVVPEDPSIQRYQVRRVEIETNPPMPVMVDGTPLGEGSLKITIRQHSLAVIRA